ncbi:hypothetical protein [Halobacillus sp. A5]|uniref:hypothetical protein n=1 Tax=Halobacillus sp. A5 TaxID=2880263 RepID=UPI0020A6995E|nr:hypothetical protein [Halobacillus sp. A5]MCP3029209.1 hypothetical protein [Halobacillus sp. A5]
MYEIVTTHKQQKKFKKTWEYFCEKYCWINDPYAADGIRYNLISQNRRMRIIRKRVIGTIEFIPYNPYNPHSTVEGRHPFSKLIEIKSNIDYVWEIDKLCIHEDFQRAGNFETFIHIMYDHIQRYKARYYVALIEKRLYRLIKFYYGYGVEKTGSELEGPASSLIPVLIDVEKIVRNDKYVEELIQARKQPESTLTFKSRTSTH